MARNSLYFLCLSLAGLALFLSGMVPTAWVEYLHAQSLFPLYRFLLSTPLSALPFSLSEVLILLLLLGILFSLGQAAFGSAPQERRARRGAWSRLGMRALVLTALLLDLYLLGFGWLYQRAPLAERLALPELSLEPTPESGQVTSAFEAEALRTARLARLARVALPEEPDLAELSAKAHAALSAVLPALGALRIPAARIKPAWPEGLLLRFSVSGIFSPITQEAHIDPGLDPLLLPFVAAHELAHLAGFAPEDEASFVAWLACTRSSDPWFRYSGQVAALARFERQATRDKDLFKRLRELAGQGILQDRMRSHQRSTQYRSPVLSHLAWQTYDKILRSQGVSEGIRSYDLMTRLILAWRAKAKSEAQPR